MLEITNLLKSYDKKQVLKGVNISVNDGEIFGFIGRNGAGKTTTIRCVTGIIGFEDGTITVDGIDVKSDPVGVKKRIAYVPDNPDLYDNMTCMQYLTFIANIFGMDQAVKQERVTSLAKELEIFDNLGDPINSLSHGMKQKIALISAFMHEPRLLILDEPFVGLDPKATYLLKQKMKELCETGSSVFFSSHVLEVVENLCHRIAFLKDGSVLASDEPKAFTKDGKTLEEYFLEMEK